MNYAVIRSGGKQYKVMPGDTLEIDKIAAEENKPVIFDDVLLVVAENKLTLGKPIVAEAKVEAKLLEQKKGEKIHVIKFKAKSRYRNKTGFRAHLSVVEIEKISLNGKSIGEKVEKATKTVKSAPKTAKK